MPLGLLPDSTYESVCLRLEPGDIVVFCSDGIHEQTNALDEEFGVGRLLAQLAETGDCATAEQVAANIVRSIDEHSREVAGCEKCFDDRTIVVLRMANLSDI